MKKFLIILTATMFITLSVKGQNLFFISEQSYPSTETFTLQSNSNSIFYTYDLNVLIAKDGTKGLIVVSTKTDTEVLISGKLIIYLDDGTVISCIDKGKNDYVDNIASTVYDLTNQQLSKMKNSNINTVRYALKCGGCYSSSEEGNWSASNKGTDFPTLITEFFD